MPSRADIVVTARGFIGVPYMHLQRNQRFMDCVGLVIAVARKYNLGDYAREDYARIPDPIHMEKNLRDRLDFIDPSRAKPGDIYWISFAGTPRHVGIIGDHPSGDQSLIHAYAEAKKVVEHRIDKKWQRRICGAFSYRGVTD